MYKVLLTSTTMRIGGHVNAAGAYSELGLPSGRAGYVTWTPEKNHPTVATGVVTFTLLRAVMVVALTKGPLAGTIISCMAEIGWQGRGTRGLWWAILGGTWLKWLSASKKIVKIQIHAGPICQTRCCCITVKGNVIVEPGFPREWAGGLDN